MVGSTVGRVDAAGLSHAGARPRPDADRGQAGARRPARRPLGRRLHDRRSTAGGGSRDGPGLPRRLRGAGGTGRPRIVCLSYFSLGAEHTEESLHNLRSYYADLGDWAEGIAQGAARSEDDVHARAKAFEQLGADELVFSPTARDLDQVDRLADVLRPGA